MTKHKITKGTVIYAGVLYKAFENSWDHSWYIVQGTTAGSPLVMAGIKAKSAKKALEHWLATVEAQ